MNETVAKALCDANVVKFGQFTYVSGKKGPIYVDIRILPSNPESMEKVSAEMASLIDTLNVDIVAGAETAGISLAAVVAQILKKPMVYIRKKPKAHGTKSNIEGVVKEGQTVVLVDDMITDGGSKVGFIEGIRNAHAVIEDSVVVLDRGQGGSDTMDSVGVSLHSLITLKELLGYMIENNLVAEEKYRQVIDYLKG